MQNKKAWLTVAEHCSFCSCKKYRKALLKEITNKFNENRVSRVSERIIQHELHKEGYFRWVVKKPVVVWEVNLKKIDKFVNFFVKSYNFVNKLYLPIGNIQISILRFTQLANI
jgi:hypothetical protein